MFEAQAGLKPEGILRPFSLSGGITNVDYYFFFFFFLLQHPITHKDRPSSLHKVEALQLNSEMLLGRSVERTGSES